MWALSDPENRFECEAALLHQRDEEVEQDQIRTDDERYAERQQPLLFAG